MRKEGLKGKELEEIINDIRKSLGCPICKLEGVNLGEQIDSHLIPKSYLKVVGKKFYCFDINSKAYYDFKNANGNVIRKSAKKVMAHKVFCKIHDEKIFKPIENGLSCSKDIKFNNEQIGLWILRAFLFNLYNQRLKIRAKINGNNIADKRYLISFYSNLDKEKLILRSYKNKFVDLNEFMITKIYKLNKLVGVLTCSAIPIKNWFNFDDGMFYINILPNKEEKNTYIIISYLNNGKSFNKGNKVIKKLDLLYKRNIEMFELEISKKLLIYDINLVISDRLYNKFSENEKCYYIKVSKKLKNLNGIKQFWGNIVKLTILEMRACKLNLFKPL